MPAHAAEPAIRGAQEQAHDGIFLDPGIAHSIASSFERPPSSVATTLRRSGVSLASADCSPSCCTTRRRGQCGCHAHSRHRQSAAATSGQRPASDARSAARSLRRRRRPLCWLPHLSLLLRDDAVLAEIFSHDGDSYVVHPLERHASNLQAVAESNNGRLRCPNTGGHRFAAVHIRSLNHGPPQTATPFRTVSQLAALFTSAAIFADRSLVSSRTQSRSRHYSSGRPCSLRNESLSQ
jgi:hypothetical protein